MNKLIFTVFVIVIHFSYIDMMTEAQMKSTSKLMRNVCQPKNKATNEQIDNMHKGIYDDAREAQCYMLCCLQTMKVINKAGKFDYNFSIKQIATLPPRYREPTKETIEACKDSMINPDLCVAAYELTKCMYLANPEYYFLP